MPFGFAIRKTTQSFIEWQKEEQRQQEERNKKHGTNAISDIERQVFGFRDSGNIRPLQNISQAFRQAWAPWHNKRQQRQLGKQKRMLELLL